MYDRIIYLFLKLRLIFFANIILKKYKVGNNSFFIGKRKEEYNKILIYLDNKYLAHMGDQIFFEPLLQILKKKNIKVDIAVTTGIKEYFKRLNYNIVDNPILKDYELIISRSDFYYELKNYQNVFLIKTTGLDDKVCNVISREVVNFLGLKEDYKKYRISKLENNIGINNELIKKIQNDEKNYYVIYSNYIDSGSMFSNKKNFIKLEKFCKKYNQEKNYKIIHVGTKKDKEKDNKKYDYVDIDLRGKTTVNELCQLISQNNVVGYIGMDNFVMHLFYIYMKNVNVCIRVKGSKERYQDIIKYVNPPFEVDGIRLNYI